MIDTHCHLEAKHFAEDRPQVIERFFQQGGKAILTMGTDQRTIEQAIQLAQTYAKVFAGIGFHPEEALHTPTQAFIDQSIVFLRERISDPQVVAVGEIGLDFYQIPDLPKRETENIRQFQTDLLIAQLVLAKQHQLPVVLHCRSAYDELYGIISQPQYDSVSMVIHCYGGSLAQTERFLALDQVYFSFTGTVTFGKPDTELHQVVRLIPLERIMVETDSPLLAPVPMRGKRNEPAYVRHIIEKIALIKQRSSSEVEDRTDHNAIRFFNLNLS